MAAIFLSACGGGGGSDEAPTVPAPSGLSYPTPLTGTVGTPLATLAPSVTGAPTAYSVSPALPAGLTLNPGTGAVSGTPTAATSQATYVITASNSGGSTTFGLVLTIQPAPLVVVTALGTFRDTIVAGLGYTSGGQSGVTDQNGQFTYEVGEPVEFFVGNVRLGTAPLGGPLITPIRLVPGGSGTSTAVLNIVRFLLMLDSDADAANGIQISVAVRSAAATWSQIDFADADFAGSLANIMAEARSADGGSHLLPSLATAQAHLRSSFLCAHSGVFAGRYVGTAPSNDDARFAMVIGAGGSLKAFGYDPMEASPFDTNFEASAQSAVNASLDGSFVALEQLGASGSQEVSGSFSGPDQISGTWEVSTPGVAESGTFDGSRIGASITAGSRYSGELYSATASGPIAVGLAAFDVDAQNNVTGALHQLESGTTLPVMGMIQGTTLTGTAGAIPLTAELSDPADGRFLDGDIELGGEDHFFLTEGCSLTGVESVAATMDVTGIATTFDNSHGLLTGLVPADAAVGRSASFRLLFDPATLDEDSEPSPEVGRYLGGVTFAEIGFGSAILARSGTGAVIVNPSDTVVPPGASTLDGTSFLSAAGVEPSGVRWLLQYACGGSQLTTDSAPATLPTPLDSTACGFAITAIAPPGGPAAVDSYIFEIQ